MAGSRPAVPKRSDPAKIRLEQRQIAEDFVDRELTKMQGDRVSTPPNPSHPRRYPPPVSAGAEPTPPAGKASSPASGREAPRYEPTRRA